MDSTTYAALGHPGVGFFTMLLIGFLAGYTAEKVTQSDHGIITNILVGIAGAFVGGRLADILQIPIFGFFRTARRRCRGGAHPLDLAAHPRLTPMPGLRRSGKTLMQKGLHSVP